MSVIVSDSGNAAYDGNLSTANAFYRAEAYNLGCYSATSTSLSATTLTNIPVTFANAGNAEGVIVNLWSSSSSLDRPITARLMEAKTVVSFDTATEYVTITAHGIADDTPVSFLSTGTLPTNLTSNAIFYVINATADTFQVSSTVGGSAVNLGGTPTGTATCWVERAEKTLALDDIFPSKIETTYTTYQYYYNGFVPFDFTTPYAVDTTASKWRYSFINGGTTGTWRLCTSDATNPFYIGWCDNQLTSADNDVLITKDRVTIDKSITLTGLTATGYTARSVCGVICRNNDLSEANVALLEWDLTPAASYTLTLKGDMLLGTNSGFRIGTSASPIPIAQKAIVTFAAPTNGTATVSRFQCAIGAISASVNSSRSSFFLYGEQPTLRKTNLASDAASGTPTLVCVDDATEWQNGDEVAIGKSDIMSQGSTVLHLISSVATTTITLTANLGTASRLAGGTVVNLSRYGIKFAGTSNSVFGDNEIFSPSFFKLKGVQFVDCVFTVSNGSYYGSRNDSTYRGQYLVEDCTVRHTGGTLYEFLEGFSVGPDGGLLNRIYGFRCGLNQSGTGLWNATMKSGRLLITDNICIHVNAVGLTETTSATRLTMTNNRIENSARWGCRISCTDAIITDNYFWGVNATTYAGFEVQQIVNPQTIARNTFNKCYRGYVFGAYSSINCIDEDAVFGDEQANTSDIVIGASSIINYTFVNTNVDPVIDTTNLADSIPGSQLSLLDTAGVANEDKVITPEGIFKRTGYNLADTTVWTGSTFGAASSGQFGLRMRPDYNAAANLDLTQIKTTGDITGKLMTVTARVKIANAAYYAGTYVLPTLRVVYDGSTSVSNVASANTNDQLLLVTLTPTTSTAFITIHVEGNTDAIDSDADFYLGELIAGLPEGVSVDTTRFKFWSNGLPLPTGSTIPAPTSVWAENAAANNTAGTMGNKLNKALSTSKFIALK